MNELKLKEGVYLTEHGKFKVLERSMDDKWKWSIDTGLLRRHPILSCMGIRITENSTGDYFAEKSLKNCEYLGEL